MINIYIILNVEQEIRGFKAQKPLYVMLKQLQFFLKSFLASDQCVGSLMICTEGLKVDPIKNQC